MISTRLASVQECPILQIANDISLLKSKGKSIIDFSIGTPNFLPEKHVYDAAKMGLQKDSGTYSSSRGNSGLINSYLKRLAQKNYDFYTSQNIVIGSGAKYLIFSIIYSLVNEGEEVIVPTPYWPTYLDIINLVGATPITVPCGVFDNYKLTPEKLEQSITPKTKAIFLNNPTNPTGTVYTKKELYELARILKKHNIYIISDDVYSDFIFSRTKYCHILDCGIDVKDLVIKVDSLSKSFGMPGWRLGMMAAPEEIANAIVMFNSNSISSVPDIVSHAAIAALTGSQSIHERMSIDYEEKMNIAFASLRKWEQINCPTPRGAFYIFPDVSKFYGMSFKNNKITNDTDFTNYLLKYYGLALVPGSVFGEPNSVRITFTCDKKDVTEGMSRLEQFLHRLTKP